MRDLLDRESPRGFFISESPPSEGRESTPRGLRPIMSVDYSYDHLRDDEGREEDDEQELHGPNPIAEGGSGGPFAAAHRYVDLST